MSRYDLTDFEWRVIEPLLPNKQRGVPRVDDRRVLNGIFWVLRSGAPCRDLPSCYTRIARGRKAGGWDRLRDAITAAHDGYIQMIDSTSVRAHQQSATAKRGSADHCLGRSGKQFGAGNNSAARSASGCTMERSTRSVLFSTAGTSGSPGNCRVHRLSSWRAGRNGIFVTAAVRDALFGTPSHNRLQPVATLPLPAALAGIQVYRLCDANFG